jgi:hypothetical protein
MERTKSPCWDCPNRRGIRKLTGKVAITLNGLRSDAHERELKQRRGCIGPKPKVGLTQTKTSIEVGAETVTETTTGQVVYFPSCSRDLSEIPVLPHEVVVGFGLSRSRTLSRPIHEVTTISRQEYDAKQAQLPIVNIPISSVES